MLATYASVAFNIWCVVVAFTGGTIPLFGWELEGSFGMGILWMVIIAPISSLVAYWLTMIIVLPLGAIFRR